MVDDKEPSYIVVKDVVEHEDGAATYSFDIGDEARSTLAEIGLEFVLYCAATQTDTQDALNMILSNAEKPTEASGVGSKGFDEYGYYGENNGPVGNPMSSPSDKDYEV